MASPHIHSHPYNLRSRVNTPAGLKTPGTATTPASKLFSSTPSRLPQSHLALQLDHVIGTTTKNPSGLSSCPDANTFTYCAGSVAVLAQVDDADVVSHRYYRARPAAIPINPSTSYYSTPTATPVRKRPILITPRKEQDITPLSRAISEDENAKTWTARERIKSVKCVSLSPNGKLLAVGETGYNPRVLLFSTSRDASCEVPLSIITDHTWGVRSVAFSPDTRFLATLGEANDGFLFVWSINPRNGAVKLCATNKCTTNICHMTWCGQHLITVGTRHIKVWHLPSVDKPSPNKRSRLRNLAEASPSANPTPLPGRNCLLGELADATFTCAVPLDDRHTVVCTDIGSPCIVDVSKSPAELMPVSSNSCPAGALGFRQGPKRLVWAGGGGEVREFDADGLLAPTHVQNEDPKPGHASLALDARVPRRSALRQSLGLSQLRPTGPIAVACLTKHAIFIDADANLVLANLDSESAPSGRAPLSSHNEPVQGVQALESDARLGAFFTWSKGGEVRFWGHNAELLRVEHIELDEGSDVEDAASNELKVLRHSSRGIFLSGDRFGVLKLTEAKTWQLLHTARAHSAEVNDASFDPESEFAATCSRDRMVQVFRVERDNLELLQTTDDHIAAVNQLMFGQHGCALLSCSSDRTVVVREKAIRESGGETMIAFLQTRIITIKASPLSMCLVPDKDNILFVSALDRQITKIDFTTGTILESFKVADHDGDDHAVLNAIQVVSSPLLGNGRSLLIGSSSTDKSVRIYDLDKQTLLSRESAHTEGISDLALLGPDPTHEASRSSFVSTGHDSTIMLWTVIKNSHLVLTSTTELTQEHPNPSYDSDNTPAKASPATLPPLRKVLTKVDIAEFVKPASPRSPSLRDLSPARLKQKSSKLGLASSAIHEGDENASPSLRRRASAEERPKSDRRSPSPPSYATKRYKRSTARGEVTNDFFTRQSEWFRRSPSPQDASTMTATRAETRANKSKLRRPPSVPNDLRTRAQTQEKRSSTVPPANELGSVNMASEQTCRILRAYRKKLLTMNGPFDLDEIEEELEAVLRVVKAKKGSKRTTNLRRTNSTIVAGAKQAAESVIDLKPTSISGSTSVATSPTSDNSPEKQSGQAGRVQNKRKESPDTGLGIDGLSVLLEKANLAEG